MSAEAYSKEGLNPNLVLFDEVHVQPNRELWDVMSLAAGARPEPLMVGITTAGARYDISGQDSLAYQLYTYGRRIVSGEVDDPTFFFAWWEPRDPDADHRDPKTWRQANPGYGDLVSAEDFESTILRTPESEFRMKRCNQFMSGLQAWLPFGAWGSCADPDGWIKPGAEVCVGFDGSFNNDSTAIVIVSCDEVPHIEVGACWERPADAGPDWSVPIADVPVGAHVAETRGRGVAGDGVFAVSGADDAGDAAVLRGGDERQLTHSGDARLARHIDAAVLKVDARGQRLTKEAKHSARLIDLAIAAVMALERASAVDLCPMPAIYWCIRHAWSRSCC